MISHIAPRPIPADGPYRVRLAGAVTVSLLVHALIISLQFGLPGIGLPGLELPWRERRAQAIDLNVVLAPPAARPAEEAPAASEPSAETVPATGLRLVPMPAPKTASVKKKRNAEKPPSPRRPPRPRVKRETPVIALNEARDNNFNMPDPVVDDVPPAPEPEVDTRPAPAAMPEPVAAPEEDTAAREREQIAERLAEEEREMRAREAAALAMQQRAEAARKQEEAENHQRSLALEAQRIEEAKRREDAERAERLALELEERRKAEEASRQAAALALKQQQEASAQRELDEAARHALELEEKRRAEALRLQAEKQQREAMELQARKQAEAAAEAARQQAAARERERQAEELAARRKAEAEAASASAAKRDREPELVLGDSPAPNARIDALPRNAGAGLAGRALELARRSDIVRNDPPAARQADSSTETPRRRSILGSKDVDVGLMMYVESWRLKIERNGSIMFPRGAVDVSRGDPVVTVAVRSDGSVEEVIIHRSSGRQELDDAVHRIVRVNARYSAFPPELARRFDVIEIRRVWNFEDRLRILEEVR